MSRAVREITAELVASGLSSDQIALVAELVAAAASGNSGGIPVDKTAEKRRAYDRERKAKSKLSGGNSGGIPRNSENALSSLHSSQSQSEEERKEEAKPKRRSGIPLPDTWCPSEDHYADAAKLHRTRGQVDAKAEEMRLWAKANGHRAVARKLDWDATFMGWMRRDWGGMNGGSHGKAGAQADRSVVAGADRVLERLRAFDEPLTKN